jgi:hypothetical protein
MPHDSMLTVILAKGIKLVSIPASGLTKKKKKKNQTKPPLYILPLFIISNIFYMLFFISYNMLYATDI